MRKLLLLLVMLGLGALSVRAQVPYVPVLQEAGTTGLSCVYPANVTSGNYGIVGVEYYNSTNTPSVSDTLGDTYATDLNDNTGGGSSVNVAVFSTTFGSSGANTVTVTITGATFNQSFCIEAPPIFSRTVDVTNSAGFSASPASVSATTTLNNDFAFCVAGGFSSSQFLYPLTSGTTTSLGFNNGADAIAGQVFDTGATGSKTCTFNSRSGTTGRLGIVAYKSKALAIVSPATIPDAATSTAYSYKMLATGGTTTLTWSISSGSLPTGLSINSSTGVISGTPTGPTTTFTVKATDGTNNATQSTTLNVYTGFNTITVTQSKTQASGSGITFTSNVTSGHLLVVLGGYNNASGGTGNHIQRCTDSLGTPFKLLLHGWYVSATSTTITHDIFAGIAPSTGADTVTCTDIEAVLEITNAQYAGNETLLNPITLASTASPITSSSLTTPVANEILISSASGFTSGAHTSVSAPFTDLFGSPASPDAAYDVVTTATGYTVTYTQTGNTDTAWGILLAAFRPSNNGTPAPPISTGYPMVL